MTKTKKWHKYTKEEVDFITQNVTKYYVPQLVKMFNEKFNANMTIYKMKNFKHRYNLYSDLPMNPLTGKEHKKRHKHTRKEWLDKVTHDIGYEYKRKDGTTYIKVNNKVGATNNYMTKAQYVYTCKYGEIPKGYVLLHKDGNTDNCDIDNLKLVSRKEQIYLKNTGLISTNEYIIDTALQIKKLNDKAKDKIKEKKVVI